jgi:hypothetical protein
MSQNSLGIQALIKKNINSNNYCRFSEAPGSCENSSFKASLGGCRYIFKSQVNSLIIAHPSIAHPKDF